MTTHGMIGTAEHQAWANMKSRCYDKNHPNYKHYGGRGITVCATWRLSFVAFFASLGKRPSIRHSLERRNNDKNYTPRNCYWVLHKLQNQNRRVRYDNRYGVAGLTWDKKAKKIRVSIGVNSGQKLLGFTASISKAKRMRRAAELKYWNR